MMRSPFRPARRVGVLGGAACACVVAAAALLAEPRSDAAGPVGLAEAAEPVQPSLLERVKAHVAQDDDLMARYAYTQERRTYRVRFGKVSNGDVHTYEWRPSPFEPGRQWRRLVAVNGVRLSEAALREQEQRERREAEARARETPAERARRLQAEQEAARQRQARLDDVARVYRFDPVGLDTLDGRPLLLYHVTPKPDVRTTSDLGKHMKKLRGRMWIDEEAAQLVRLEMEVAEDLTIGLGMIGRVDSGARLSYDRRRFGDAWLPAEARFSGHGRTLLLLPFHLETWSKYKDYQPVTPLSTVLGPGQVAGEGDGGRQ